MAKKEMKMNLWTFSVLIIALITLIVGIIIGTIGIIKHNEKIENTNNTEMITEIKNNEEIIDIDRAKETYNNLLKNKKISDAIKGVRTSCGIQR